MPSSERAGRPATARGPRRPRSGPSAGTSWRPTSIRSARPPRCSRCDRTPRRGSSAGATMSAIRHLLQRAATSAPSGARRGWRATKPPVNWRPPSHMAMRSMRLVDLVPVGDVPGQPRADDTGDDQAGGEPVGLLPGHADPFAVAAGEPGRRRGSPRPTMSPNVRSWKPPIERRSGNVWYGIAASAHRRSILVGRDRVPPAAHVLGQRVGRGRAHRALLVQERLGRVVEHGADDAPLLVEAVGPAEAAAVALERVLEQALVGLLPRGRGPGRRTRRGRSAGVTSWSPGSLAWRCRVTPSLRPMRNRSSFGAARRCPSSAKSRRGGSLNRTTASVAVVDERTCRCGSATGRPTSATSRSRSAGPRRSRRRSPPATPVLVGVAAVLAPHHRRRVDRADLAEQPGLLVGQRVGVRRHRRLHRHAAPRSAAGGSAPRRAAPRRSRRTCRGCRRRSPRPS